MTAIVPQPMSRAQFQAQEKAEAQAIAQENGFDGLTVDQLKARLASYPLPAVRMASRRWSCTGKRSRQAVIAEIVEALSNPHVNQGDDLPTALGHVEASRRWLERYGYL